MFGGDIVGIEGQNDPYGKCWFYGTRYPGEVDLSSRTYNAVQPRVSDRSHAGLVSISALPRLDSIS